MTEGVPPEEQPAVFSEYAQCIEEKVLKARPTRRKSSRESKLRNLPAKALVKLFRKHVESYIKDADKFVTYAALDLNHELN